MKYNDEKAQFRIQSTTSGKYDVDSGYSRPTYLRISSYKFQGEDFFNINSCVKDMCGLKQ